MDTPSIADRIKELNIEVEKYRTVKTGVGKATFAFSSNSTVVYYLIPSCVLILLLFLKPSFLYNTEIKDDGKETQKLAYKKVFISWLIISTLLVIGLFGFNYTKKTYK